MDHWKQGRTFDGNTTWTGTVQGTKTGDDGGGCGGR